MTKFAPPLSSVELRKRFEAEARRQSLAIAEYARDPSSDEFAVMREIEDDLRDDAWVDC